MDSRGLLMPLLALLGLVLGCGGATGARSEQSFDEIAGRVAGMSAAEILGTLGEPDSRQPVFLRDERWIWWNFTFLAGDDYPPEVRGRVVHLEITLRDPGDAGGAPRPHSEWRIAQPYGIRYLTPGEQATRTASESTRGRQGG